MVGLTKEVLLNQNPGTHTYPTDIQGYMPVLVVHTSNHSTREAEAEDLKLKAILDYLGHPVSKSQDTETLKIIFEEIFL